MPVDPRTLDAGAQRKFRIGETAYEHESGLLYIIERVADSAKPVIHVLGISITDGHSNNS
jgi:hypothetical protein